MATQTELAEHLDLTQGALSNLIRRGVLPPAEGTTTISTVTARCILHICAA